MITTHCVVCDAPVVVVRGRGDTTCSARCASESSRIHDLHISPAEQKRLCNFVGSAAPNTPMAIRLGCGVVRLVVEVEGVDGVAEHKAVAP